MTKGQLAQLGAKFLQVLPLEADKDEVQAAIDNGNDPLWVGIVSRFAKKIEATTKTVAEKVSSLFHITVNYGLSLKEMIAAGGYDWKNDDITEARFPVPTGSPVELDTELIHFDYDISSENVVAELDKKGYRPATIHELLAFGAKYPNKQREFPIVALGSVAGVGGDRRVAYLDGGGDGRRLGLGWWVGGWSRSYRFLAVRKVSGS